MKASDGPLPGAVDRVEHAYDEYGREVSCTVAGATWAKVFDALGRLDAETDPLGYFGYSYDGNTGRVADRVTVRKHGKGVYSWVGNTGRFDGVASGPGARPSDSRKAGNRRFTDAVSSGAGGLATDLEWFGDGAGEGARFREVKEIATRAGGGAVLLSRNGYGYDGMSAIVEWTLEGPVNDPARRWTLGYDAAGQLVSSVQSDASGGAVLGREQHIYDKAGNEIGRQSDPGGAGGAGGLRLLGQEFNAVNQLLSGSASGAGRAMRWSGTTNEAAAVTVNGSADSDPDPLRFAAAPVAVSGTNTVSVVATDTNNQSRTSHYRVVVDDAMDDARYTYDANGNLTSGSRAGAVTSYGWDAADRLIRIERGAATTEFEYDGFGRRVRTVEKVNGNVVGEERHVWVGLALAETRDASGSTVLVRYFDQGEQQGATGLYYIKDHLGSIRGLADASGAVVGRYGYDLWGARTYMGGTANTARGYTGHFHHAPSGLVLAPYRAYAPDTHRWLSRDPIEEKGGINLYGYVRNRVISYYDIYGLSESWPWTAWDILPPVAFVHAFYDLSAVPTEGVLHYMDAWTSAQDAASQRDAEYDDMFFNGRACNVTPTSGGPVGTALPSIAEDASIYVTSIPGTSFTGPAGAPKSGEDLLSNAVTTIITGVTTQQMTQNAK